LASSFYYLFQVISKTFLRRHTTGIAIIAVAILICGLALWKHCPRSGTGKPEAVQSQQSAQAPSAAPRQVVVNPAGQSTNLQDEINTLQNLYDQAPAKSPLKTRLLFAIGETYVKYGQVRPAIASFEGVLQSSPNEKRSHYYLGELYLSLGDSAKAKTYWTRYLELDPNSYIKAFLSNHK
jgi:tetratricopeptide (TPR) repeat protein